MKLKGKLVILCCMLFLMIGIIIYFNQAQSDYLVGSAVYQANGIANNEQYVLDKGVYFPPENLQKSYKVIDVDENTIVDLVTEEGSQSLTGLKVGDKIEVSSDVIVINVDSGTITVR